MKKTYVLVIMVLLSCFTVSTAGAAAIPAAPSALEAEAVSSYEMLLTWEDNSDNESGFKIQRKKSGGEYTLVDIIGKDNTDYTDTGLAYETKYYYRIWAYNSVGDSVYSNEASATTGDSPDKPTDLNITAISSSKVELTWVDNSDDENGFTIERKKSDGSYLQIATVGKNDTNYTNTGLSSDTKYSYRVRAYNSSGNSAYTGEASAATLGDETIIRLVIGNTTYYVNNTAKTMDTAPVIRESRTLLPIRFVAEAIGAKVAWNNDERKVTITLNGKIIDLWIGVNLARVNGQYKFIDPTNPLVVPVIADPGRTMLPLRFVSENLGAKVDWNSDSREVLVTYPAP